MLVFRRRAGESFLIGDDIEIIVLAVEPLQVKLGIVAPQKIPVLRTEILQAHEQNNRAAAAAPSQAALEHVVERFRARRSNASS